MHKNSADPDVPHLGAPHAGAPHVSAPAATLERWLTGPRFGPLPARRAGHKPPLLSFEFMPPKTEAMEQQLWTCIRRLEPLRPRFVSVTYGAGGSTQARTHATVTRLVKETSLVPAAHLTCVGACREEVDAVARSYWEAGVRHIVALRGDAPAGETYAPHPQGYDYRGGSGGWADARGAVRDLGRRVSRTAPAGGLADGRPG